MKETIIQLKILKHLQAKGIYCWRNNNGALWDPKLRIYRNNPLMKPGIADIIAVHNGKHIEIECKTDVGRQSPAQKIHQKRIEAAGGVYILARSVEDVNKVLDSI